MSDEMARFAANFLNEGLAGIKIDGFGVNAPPAPTFVPDDFAPEADVIPEDSPLRALTPRPVAPAVPEPPVSRPQVNAGLQVLDGWASFNGQQVDLNEREQSAVAQIVLKAVVKRAKEQYQRVASQITKRAYKRRVNAETGAGDASGVSGGDGGRKSRNGTGKRGRPRTRLQGGEGGGKGPEASGEARGEA